MRKLAIPLLPLLPVRVARRAPTPAPQIEWPVVVERLPQVWATGAVDCRRKSPHYGFLGSKLSRMGGGRGRLTVYEVEVPYEGRRLASDLAPLAAVVA